MCVHGNCITLKVVLNIIVACLVIVSVAFSALIYGRLIIRKSIRPVKID